MLICRADISLIGSVSCPVFNHTVELHCLAKFKEQHVPGDKHLAFPFLEKYQKIRIAQDFISFRNTPIARFWVFLVCKPFNQIEGILKMLRMAEVDR